MVPVAAAAIDGHHSERRQTCVDGPARPCSTLRPSPLRHRCPCRAVRSAVAEGRRSRRARDGPIGCYAASGRRYERSWTIVGAATAFGAGSEGPRAAGTDTCHRKCRDRRSRPGNSVSRARTRQRLRRRFRGRVEEPSGGSGSAWRPSCHRRPSATNPRSGARRSCIVQE